MILNRSLDTDTLHLILEEIDQILSFDGTVDELIVALQMIGEEGNAFDEATVTEVISIIEEQYSETDDLMEIYDEIMNIISYQGELKMTRH